MKDYNNRIWSKRSNYFSKESVRVLRELAYLLNESQAYVLNMLIQDRGLELVEELKNE